MGNRAQQAKAFLGQWYIINAAKNWFDFDITFNQVDEVISWYNKEQLKPGEEREERFERALQRYVEHMLKIREREAAS